MMASASLIAQFESELTAVIQLVDGAVKGAMEAYEAIKGPGVPEVVVLGEEIDEAIARLRALQSRAGSYEGCEDVVERAADLMADVAALVGSPEEAGLWAA